MQQPDHKAIVDKYISTDHKGKPIDKRALLKPNPMIAKALVARVMSMTPQQAASLKTIVTPQTADALKVLMPELAQLIDKDIASGQAGGANGAG